METRSKKKQTNPGGLQEKKTENSPVLSRKERCQAITLNGQPCSRKHRKGENFNGEIDIADNYWYCVQHHEVANGYKNSEPEENEDSDIEIAGGDDPPNQQEEQQYKEGEKIEEEVDQQKRDQEKEKENEKQKAIVTNEAESEEDLLMIDAQDNMARAATKPNETYEEPPNKPLKVYKATVWTGFAKINNQGAEEYKRKEKEDGLYIYVKHPETKRLTWARIITRPPSSHLVVITIQTEEKNLQAYAVPLNHCGLTRDEVGDTETVQINVLKPIEKDKAEICFIAQDMTQHLQTQHNRKQSSRTPSQWIFFINNENGNHILTTKSVWYQYKGKHNGEDDIKNYYNKSSITRPTKPSQTPAVTNTNSDCMTRSSTADIEFKNGVESRLSTLEKEVEQLKKNVHRSRNASSGSEEEL